MVFTFYHKKITVDATCQSASVMLMNISSATLKQVAAAVCGLHNT
jgi:hypothetical protein